ncbi:HNH endonuclease [Clavibacter michiganensis subsp. michiganensis]|jgi:hypothetical protein|uniref:hypothetical protein n=1 Tax=Clavibacter michiganensis TaxID=28447 RepID=UPI001C6500C5|nr:hypothetical protein [Clavibacter michiganensis]MBW8025302.1 HNH endonuclease [Clavibacter michiganensis subsp. michiganensis]
MGQHHPHTRRMDKVKADFRKRCAAEDLPCWLCTQPIDYDAPTDDYKNESRFQPDHYFPASERPDLYDDPSNLRPSHAGCNQRRSNQAPRAGLRPPSRQWT